jgi:hypothetical protein
VGAWPHGMNLYDQGPRKMVCTQIMWIKWFINFIIVIFYGLLASFLRFWLILGDIGPFLRPNLGRKLGDGYHIQIYINQVFLRPWEYNWWFITALCCRIFEPKPLSCREATKERTFAGHFWEPRSSDLGVVSFDGFMRSGRT